MNSNFRTYDYLSSFERIDAILVLPQGNYEEKGALPDRDTLTFTNGFYAYCPALFIDIRDSSTLPSKYNRPALAKLYRAFISEMTAIFNSVTFAPAGHPAAPVSSARTPSDLGFYQSRRGDLNS